MLVDQCLPGGAERVEFERARDPEHVLHDPHTDLLVAGGIEEDTVLEGGQREP